MHRQTIRTFYEVKNGVVKVLHTDPMLSLKGSQNVAEEVRMYAEGGIECRTEKEAQG